LAEIKFGRITIATLSPKQRPSCRHNSCSQKTFRCRSAALHAFCHRPTIGANSSTMHLHS